MYNVARKNSFLDARTLWFDQEKGPGFKLSIVLYDQMIDLEVIIFNPEQLFIRYSLLLIFSRRY